MRLTDLLSLSVVPRWSIVPIRRPQSVMEHSFRVAVIYRELCERLQVPLTDTDIWACLIHDAPECRSGDIPGVFKHELRGKGGDIALIEADHAATPWVAGEARSSNSAILKLADLIEAYTFIKMYGDGPHADGVGWRIRKQIVDYVGSIKPDGGIDASVINRVISDIVGEEGRL